MEQTISLKIRVLETMSPKDRYRYVGEAFFLCPSIFGDDDRNKYPPVMTYWLSQSVISHVVRDKFTSGGTAIHTGVTVSQIIDRAIKRKSQIRDAARSLSNDVIEEYWPRGSTIPAGGDQRILEWLNHVDREYSRNVKGFTASELKDHLKILHAVFI